MCASLAMKKETVKLHIKKERKIIMKKRMWMLSMIAVLSMGTAGAVFAQDAETETETATEITTEAEDEDVLETIILQPEGKDKIEVANTAKVNIRSASVEVDEETNLAKVTLAGKDGTLYEFENVNYEDITEAELVKAGAFLKILYTGKASGEKRSAGQKGELIYDEPTELFAIDDVYMRSEPDNEAEILDVISRGDKLEVLGETATHFKVNKDGVEGYASRVCISEDEQEAIAAVQAEAAARQASAPAAPADNGGYTGDTGYVGVYEVSRQRFDDCDGSGHGYFAITYSDGSVAYEEY